MDNKYKAHKKVYRKQQVKTYSMRILLLPKYTIGVLSLIIMFVAWVSLGKMIKASNMKLTMQKENWKPVKKNAKMDKKYIKKEIQKGGEVNVQIDESEIQKEIS